MAVSFMASRVGMAPGLRREESVARFRWKGFGLVGPVFLFWVVDVDEQRDDWSVTVSTYRRTAVPLALEAGRKAGWRQGGDTHPQTCRCTGRAPRA